MSEIYGKLCSDVGAQTETLLNRLRQMTGVQLEVVRLRHGDDIPDETKPTVYAVVEFLHRYDRPEDAAGQLGQEGFKNPLADFVPIKEIYFRENTHLLLDTAMRYFLTGWVHASVKYGALITIAKFAKEFMWQPENWENYDDLKTSNSASLPAEFCLLGDAVEKAFGPPNLVYQEGDAPKGKSVEQEVYRNILLKVLTTGTEDEFFERTIFGGGSVTLDATTGELVYFSKENIEKLAGSDQ